MTNSVKHNIKYYIGMTLWFFLIYQFVFYIILAGAYNMKDLLFIDVSSLTSYEFSALQTFVSLCMFIVLYLTYTVYDIMLTPWLNELNFKSHHLY